MLRIGLVGNVPALCAAACVSRGWRDAAADPALWQTLGSLPRRVAARLTDARLRALVARAGGALRCIHLSDCTQLTDKGLKAALAPERALAYLCIAGCRKLTAKGVAAALAGKQLVLLRAHGVATTRSGNEAAAERAFAHVQSLARSTDVSTVCSAETPNGLPCLRLCGSARRGGACSLCEDAVCEFCCIAGRLPKCHACGARFCEPCAEDMAGLTDCDECGRRFCPRCALCDHVAGGFPICDKCGVVFACAGCMAYVVRRPFRSCAACEAALCGACLRRDAAHGCGRCGATFCLKRWGVRRLAATALRRLRRLRVAARRALR